jgi:glycosyltransferase involved in cell wall biosynthesis
MLKKQKLLVFSDCYIYGGSERLMSFLVKNKILNNNYEIRFAFRAHEIYKKGMENDFANSLEKVIPISLLANETLFYKINSGTYSSILKASLKMPFWILEKIGVYSIYNAVILFNLLDKEKPEILHINNGGFPAAPSCNLLVFVAKNRKIKKIIYQVNNQAQKTTIFNKFKNQKIGEYVNSFITASNMAKDNLANNAGMDSGKINIIRNIVQLNSIKINRDAISRKFGLSKGTFIMVNVAFLTNRKGQIYLLQALKRWIDISNSKLDVCLFLIGDGEDQIVLLNYCKQNKLDNYVHFLGYQSNYADYINASNLVVFPSISNEDLPLVIIESLMLGKCILATSLAGISEVIQHNLNGILISPNLETITDDLLDSMNNLFSKPQEIQRLSHEAKVSSLSFSEEIYGKTLINLYQKC